tara:strand:+ start:527 stop:1597 length:1071 start_codon:yes stop_codon:yes gene_type:complete
MKSVPNSRKFSGLGHNARLERLLDNIEGLVAVAQSDTDLVNAISLLDPLPKPVRFKANTHKKNILFGAYFFLFCGAVNILLTQTIDFSLFLFGTAGLFYIGSSMMHAEETDQLIHLSEQIHQRSRLFDYGLEPVKHSELPDFKGFYRQFHTFEHGSYISKVHHLLSGHYQGTDHSFTYRYFHITYTKAGRSKDAETHVRPHGRCGFIVPFSLVKNLRISDHALKFFKPTWNSGSNQFNIRFAVEASDDLATAKFLKPALLREIEAAGAVLSYIDLEFNAAGDLCFSFDDTTTLNGMRRTGLHDPAAFKEEILAHNNMSNMDAALEFLHRLMKYSDNNFDQNTNTQSATKFKTGSTA